MLHAQAIALPDPLALMSDPVLAAPPLVYELNPRTVALWREALRRPEYDVRVQAIEAIATARAADADGLEDFAPELAALLRDDAHEAVRDSAARALVLLDAKEFAGDLLAAAEGGRVSDAVVFEDVCPALATWSYAEALPVWREWITQQRSPRLVTAALRGLGALRDASAVELLTSTYVLNADAPVALRIEAARAVGQITTTGQLSAAQQLATTSDVTHGLIALAVLTSHREAEAVALVRSLLQNDGAVVRTQALRWLTQADSHVADIALPMAGDADAAVRLAAIEALTTSSPAQAIDVLGHALRDTNTAVRRAACLALLSAANDRAQLESVQAKVHTELAGDDWRALEQAALAAAALTMEDEADRLVALLGNDRPEVRVAAATALRVLQLPGTADAALARCEAITAMVLSPDTPAAQGRGMADESTQLFMLLGKLRHRAAEAVLLKYLPKRSGYQAMSRGAAVYALGLIHAGEAAQVPELVTQLEERLGDNNPLDPEVSEVRRFAAVALGRMGSSASAEVLAFHYEEENSSVEAGASSRWALGELRGVELPALRPVARLADPAFLESLD